LEVKPKKTRKFLSAMGGFAKDKARNLFILGKPLRLPWVNSQGKLAMTVLIKGGF
jgi:hypothetical protein